MHRFPALRNTIGTVNITDSIASFKKCKIHGKKEVDFIDFTIGCWKAKFDELLIPAGKS